MFVGFLVLDCTSWPSAVLTLLPGVAVDLPGFDCEGAGVEVFGGVLLEVELEDVDELRLLLELDEPFASNSRFVIHHPSLERYIF